MAKPSLPKRLEDFMGSPAWMEILVVYMAGVLPFLGSLVRDVAIVAEFPVAEANAFYRLFFLSNLISHISVEYVWTKYNSLTESHIRIPFAEIGLLLCLNGIVAMVVFGTVLGASFIWVLIPPLNLLGAYPIGICNGLKKYLSAKILSTLPNIIMAALAVSLAVHLPSAYALSLLAVFPVALSLLFMSHRLRWDRGRLDFKRTAQSILLNAAPLIVFYYGNFLLLGLNREGNPAVLWGNRISNYLFTFLLLGVPVFINALKNRTVTSHFFGKFVRYASMIVAAVFLIAVLTLKKHPALALIVVNMDLSLLCAFIFYLTKIILVRKIHLPGRIGP